ncbi:peptidase M1 [Pseudoalteromonas luteoviolacea]|uniref:M1 family aminopeptidase n=1 Tax=Pseudoalteromonas luteoviolacea TaxID=43657 RepID=UPI001B3A75E5|nr:peptidase M1 [Pseudoalteromonas luteoviolacea]MBQ4908027.1 peptidase M1 [Pseudoalteromonas luteoviolacea]
MPKILIVLFAFCANCVSAEEAFSKRMLQLAAKKYQLNYDIDIKQRNLSASGKITVINTSQKSADHIPLRLYRLLQVTSVTNSEGLSIPFTQQVLSNEDWPVLQTNYVELKLDKALKPNEIFTFEIKYKGTLLGYTETGMNYVKDTISENFSIIRMDAFAYPLVTYPNDLVNRKAKFWLNRYDYDITITVPNEYVVANGGQLMSRNEHATKHTYRYTNKLPAWRMDFAIARYAYYVKGKYSIFSWESSQNSQALLEKIANTFDLYAKWFGPLEQELGYTFIEVPENYGAQADVTSVIQDAKGFKELDRVYHEISHQWNVKSLDVHSPRWNEGLATFLEALTLDKLDSPGHLSQQTAKTLNKVKDTIKHNQQYDQTAFIEYGKEGLNSYTVGMIFFHLLYDLVGENEFNHIIGSFYRTFYATGSTTEQFIQFVKRNSRKDLAHFFDEWAYSPVFAKRLNEFESYKELYQFYKVNNQTQSASIVKLK